jgi:hypothetical protein
MATEDRFMTAFSSLVRRALDNDGTIDRRALYPAKVVKWEASGIFPSGTVDVIFNNDDAGESATKLQTISAVPVLPPFVGMAYKPQAGTQCLIGWQGADERLPYATGWLGLGSSTQTDLVASLVNLGAVGGDWVTLKPLYDALLAFANALTVTPPLTTVAQILAVAATLQQTLTNPLLKFYTDKTKAS